jgi:hypothetical protein
MAGYFEYIMLLRFPNKKFGKLLDQFEQLLVPKTALFLGVSLLVYVFSTLNTASY